MKLKELNDFLITTFKDYLIDDYLKNGLEIEGKEEINKILFGVSFNKQITHFAIKNNYDAIITHHGIFGKNFFDLTGILSLYIRKLIKNNISLFSFHLPLDKHKEIGNNISICKILNLEIIDELEVGYIGINKNSYTIKQICDLIYDNISTLIKLELIKKCDFTLNKNINHYIVSGFNLLLNNNKIPEKICVISGGASDSVKLAYQKGCDLFITGEIKLYISDFCYATGINYLSLGHYYSEIFGIINLQNLISKEFNVETFFFNDENLL